jgi:hypothetical protein
LPSAEKEEKRNFGNMRSLLFIAFLLLSFRFMAQDPVVPLKKRDFPLVGGIAGYYFWEEDSAGFLLSDPRQPFLQNYLVEIAPSEYSTNETSLAQLRSAVDFFAAEPGTDQDLDKFYIGDSLKQIAKIRFPLHRKPATRSGSVIFRKTANGWESLQRGKVLYFNVDTTGKVRYSHASDSVVLFYPALKVAANSHYVVWNYLREDGYIGRQSVRSYGNGEVTEEFYAAEPLSASRMLLFINGYRGPKRNRQPTDGLVVQKDRYGYWYKLDNRFIDVLKPDVSYYADGSLPIATSNHRTRLGFAWSYLRTRLTPKKSRSKRIYRRLNSEGNNEGFDERQQRGQLAGLAFLDARCSEPQCAKTRDTLDIVCHSMGYAYALGLIETVKDKVVLGKIYILAPENACYKGADWSEFEEVWQYGSNLDQEDPDPVREQDGIAPQCGVKGLDKLPPARAGRAFIPRDWPNKNFVDSHMIYSYDWIFDRIAEGQPGYIHR